MWPVSAFAAKSLCDAGSAGPSLDDVDSADIVQVYECERVPI